MQMFSFFINDFWQFPVIFKKYASRLLAHFFKAFLGLDILARTTQLTTNTKKITPHCFRG